MMAERGSARKTTASISQAKKPLSSSKMAGRSKRCETRHRVHSGTPGLTTKPEDEFLAKEEHYKLLNAELEAKTTVLVRQAEQLMRDQSDVLSKPLSTVQLTDLEDNEDARILMPSQNQTRQKPHVKLKTKQMAKPKNMNMEKQLEEKTITSKMLCGDDLAVLEESAETFLAKTIKNIEENMDDTCTERADTPFLGEITAPCISDAQIRVLKAKLQIMQEELDQQTSQYYKKDDENIRLNAKLKELEEDRARLQQSQCIQQTQIEKYKALAEESVKRCEGLQLQVAALNKEIENLNRSTKQTAAVHNTVEIRLNRALEESQRLKTELNKIKQMSKDKVSEEHQSKENLLAENKTLRKQKAELIVGFKKQLKLIDILKQQKMHLEASKLLSFTEDEFMKVLDWGKS